MAMGQQEAAAELQEQYLYRICPEDEWAAAQAAGALHGGELDTTSGFIHLSTASQVAGTLARFYTGRGDLYLLEIDASKLGGGLRYDEVAGVGLFPHFYGPHGTFSPLPLSAVESVDQLKLDGGKQALPSAFANS